MRLWKHILQNWIADSILALGVGMTAIAVVLLASDMIINATHNH